MFDIKSLIIFCFIAFNFILLIRPQNRVNIASLLVINNLLLIFFLSLKIINQDIFLEIILFLILFLMINLIIIKNQKEISSKLKKIKDKRPSFKIIIFAFFVICLTFFSSIILSKITYKKINQKQEENLIATLQNQQIQGEDKIENSLQKQISQEKLQKNFLFKRFFDVILIAASLIVILLVI